MTPQKIDCHTHIVNEEIRSSYFARTDGYAIVMEFPASLSAGVLMDDAWKTVKGERRLFLCPCIDLRTAIPPQLERIEARMQEVPVVGVKIYLTYQAGRADDDILMPVYEFCRRHRLTVTYHTGSCALTLPSDNDLAGSDAKYVARAAEQFPDVNFVLAHMDDPRYMECIRILQDHPNMFTDFCGAYEPGTKEGSDMEWAIRTFARAIHQYPESYKQILYGTDFCPPIDLIAVEEYEYTVERIFRPEQLEAVYRTNCLRAYPRLRDFITEKESSSNE